MATKEEAGMTSEEKDRLLDLFAQYMRLAEDNHCRMDLKFRKDDSYMMYPGGTGPDVCPNEDGDLLRKFIRLRHVRNGRPE